MSRDPGDPRTRILALIHSGRPADALDLILRELRRHPSDLELNHAAGALLADSGDTQRALFYLERAAASKPPNPDWLHAHGAVLARIRRFDDAARQLRAALNLRPNHEGAAVSLLDTLVSAVRLEEAIREGRALLPRLPSAPALRFVLMSALLQSGRADEALSLLREGLQLSPGEPLLTEGLVSVQQYLNGLTPSERLANIQATGRAVTERAAEIIPPQPPFTNSKDPGRPLRIGYISPDLREHSVAYFFEPLLSARNRDGGGLTHHCYFTSRRSDTMTAHLRSRADSWTDAATLSNAQIAAKIREDRIDILFDLAGYSSGSRPEVFAARAAPIQLNYIGWAQSTGIPAMDYRIVDSLTDPHGADAHCSEQLLRLDPCFLCYQPPAVSPATKPRQPGRPTAFGSFNAITKITPAVLDAWAAILTRVPDSTLLLKAWGLEDPACGQRMTTDLAARGINPARIQTRGKTTDNTAHLALYNEIDIALDTFPYDGTTTTCEALWMGVPVIGLAGDTHLSRVGLSLLTCMGLAQLIAPTVEDYITLASDIASDPAHLDSISGEQLRDRLRTSPLCDQASFAVRFTAAMRQVWRDWCTGGNT